ncbi:hypothetical protein [Fluviicola sp.]|jgi:uncharacterized Zn finger protein (UPF0148 family)|uniref:hypothetical protein n=1 Tax=Fluviicola sp. TaxID=1917219 RepID=UPI002819C9F7|nr:hypothetical protein [Fluviicola sp.]MDR0800944.1 transposase [Fluviicola sp.]
MEENKKTLSLLERMKQKAVEQKSYGGEYVEQSANVNTKTCPNCGAGRAQQDGLTHCAYCGFEFLSVKLTDGIHIKESDNSQNI